MLGLSASILQVSECKCGNVTNPHDRLQKEYQKSDEVTRIALSCRIGRNLR
jgi:hypothetical protein